MTELRRVGQFYVYQCKDCQTFTLDPQNHSLTDQHFKGYVARVIPVDQEVTEEELAKEAGEVKNTAKATVAKLAKEASQRPPN